MSEAVPFRGGIPYALDVKKLNEAFTTPSLTEGRLITHEMLETVLGEKRATQRYYGVVNSWIHQQRNSNGIFVVWVPAQGIKVLSPSEILEYSETRTRQKIRQTGQAVRTFAWVDRNRLDETGQKRLDHQMRVTNAMKNALDSAKRELAVELAPVHSLPKPKILKQA